MPANLLLELIDLQIEVIMSLKNGSNEDYEVYSLATFSYMINFVVKTLFLAGIMYDSKPFHSEH